MFARILVTVVAYLLSATAAMAQCTTYPNNVTNGTTADASQVMANFNYIWTCSGAPLAGPVWIGYTADQGGGQPLQVNGGIFSSGPYVLNVLSGDGWARVTANSTNGIILEGQGSTYDALLYSQGGPVLGAKHDTQAIQLPGYGAGALQTDSSGNVSTTAATFVSGQQNVPSAGTTLTVAHGLGAVPFSLTVVLHCVTAEQGWSVGDEPIVYPGSMAYSGGGYSASGLQAWMDSTNVYLLQGSNGNLYLPNKGTGAQFAITQANWQLIIKARL